MLGMKVAGHRMNAKTTEDEFSNRSVGLAPMEGVTDFATRLWIAQNGAPDFTTTPFLRVTKDYPSKRISANFLPEIQLSKEHGIVPCIPQLMASSEDDLIRIAGHFLEKVGFIDINCGCPSPTVVGHGAGSSLLQNPDRFSEYLERIISACGAGRVSVKMRLGFHHENEFARLLEILRNLPLARLTVHGRTRADRYTGSARWSFIGEAARRLPYPVFGSGDVVSAASLQTRHKDAPQIAGVIIGRGALRDPWIFARLRDPSLRVRKEEFRLRLIQFIVLQEIQALGAETLPDLAGGGIFAFPSESERLNMREFIFKQLSAVFCKVPSMANFNPEDPARWTLGRASIARGKMLWNYLRSGLGVAPELTTRILRTPTWVGFIEALDDIVVQLPEDDVGLTHRPEWDWVYAGAGHTGQATGRD
jgi:tRNA-dihydrouridine synthase